MVFAKHIDVSTLSVTIVFIIYGLWSLYSLTLE